MRGNERNENTNPLDTRVYQGTSNVSKARRADLRCRRQAALSALGLLAVQHIILMSSTLVLPIVLVTEIGGDFTQVQSVVALTMMACGIGTILQAMHWRGIGSGYLCPNLCRPEFLCVLDECGVAWRAAADARDDNRRRPR